MEQRLTFFTIGVQDLESVKTFYKDVFGWTPMKDSDGIVFFKLNGFILGLYPSHELAADIGIQNDGKGFKRVTMAINFNSENEVDAVFEKLVKGGAKSILKPEKVFWGGYRGYIADPENNYWEIAFNPFLKMTSAGNVDSHA